MIRYVICMQCAYTFVQNYRMNGISQDLFIYVNTILSKATFLFKLLALVPLIKLDHFMVKDAFFFRQPTNWSKSSLSAFDSTLLFTVSSPLTVVNDWLIQIHYTNKLFFFKHTDTITILFLLSCSQVISNLAPRVSLLPGPRFRGRKEESPWERG